MAINGQIVNNILNIKMFPTYTDNDKATVT